MKNSRETLLITLLSIVLVISATYNLSADSIKSWGYQVVGVDMSSGFTAVAASDLHSLGLKQDGSIVAWGDNEYGQCNVPEPNAGFIAIAAYSQHNLGLKQDGSIVAWGANDYGECNVPSPNADFITVEAGGWHSLAIVQVCGYILDGDLNDDCKVDFDDFAAMASNWLIDCTIDPNNPKCVPK